VKKWGVVASLAAIVIMGLAAGPEQYVPAGQVVSLAVPAKVSPTSMAAEVRVTNAAGEPLVHQLVDHDGDGKFDELLVLATKDERAQDITCEVSAPGQPLPPAAPELKNRVAARYVPERKDDFAWENDLVAFRAYGPGLRAGIENAGIDVMTKRVPYPVLDDWYKLEKMGKSYHVDTGTGYDGYKVNASLGCGGSAVWSQDRLWLGETYETWKQYAAGPLRAVFELDYGPWTVDGKQITEKKIISLDLGSRLFKVVDTYLVDGKPAPLKVAVGVATHDGKAEAAGDAKTGVLSAWEMQDGAGLGTAVVIAPRYVAEYREIRSDDHDQNNAVFIVNPDEQGRFVYYAGFAWEKWGGITTPEEWRDYLAQFAAGIKE
jgi:hypothetical protein